MNKLHCEHASDVSRAVRTGFWPNALAQHAQTCSACTETRTVTAALVESSSLSASSPPPDAAQVWIESRRRARLHLRHRALLWFRALRILACVYIPAMLVWALSRHPEPAPSAWKPALHLDFAASFTGTAEKFAIAGALLAAVCITMGSWYLLREARTILQHSASR